MATNKSRLEQESGPMKHSVTHAPSRFVLVVGSREECDPRILELCDGGFLTLHFDSGHKHPAYHPEAGTFVPSDDEIRSFEEDGQINPGTGYRDGDKYIINSGRGRLKKCAIINARRSEKSGKHTESFLYLFTVASKGITEEEVFTQSVGENFDRRDEKPTTIGFLVRRARETYRWSVEKCEQKFHIAKAMQDIYISLLDCAEEVRAYVDQGKIPVRSAAVLLSRVERDLQMAHVRQVWEAGIRRGTAFHDALRRVISGESIFGDDESRSAPNNDSGSDSAPPDSEDAAEASAESSNNPEDAGHDSDSGETGNSEGAGNTKKSRKPVDNSARLRPPTPKTREKWIEVLKPHTQARDIEFPKGTPKSLKDAVKAEIDSARLDGGRVMLMRMQGKAPKGWGLFRDLLEVSDNPTAK